MPDIHPSVTRLLTIDRGAAASMAACFSKARSLFQTKQVLTQVQAHPLDQTK